VAARTPPRSAAARPGHQCGANSVRRLRLPMSHWCLFTATDVYTGLSPRRAVPALVLVGAQVVIDDRIRPLSASTHPALAAR
jgi:hypothetical protein